VAVTFTITGGGGAIVPASPATISSGPSGVAQLTSWTVGSVVGPNTLSAAAPGLTGSPLTFTATAIAGAATQMALFGGNGQSATVGTTLPSVYAVRVLDAANNPVQGVTVAWTVTGGGGSITPSSQTDANGVATATRTLGTTAGTQTATGSVGGLTGSPVQFTATATAGSATQLAFTVQPANAAAGATISPPIQVTARDGFGNTATSFGGSVSLAIGTNPPGSGALDGTTSVAAASGIATFAAVDIDEAGNGYTLTASATGLTGATSAAFNVTTGAAASMTLNAGNGQSATVGTAVAIDPSVVVRDAFNNPVSGVSVTFTVTGGGGAIVPASPATVATNASGIAAVTSWTLGTGAGTNTLQAAAAGLTGSPVVFTATGTPGAPSGTASTIATTSPITACSTGCSTAGGTQSIITITVRDGFNNPINGASVTWAATGAGNTATNPTGTTNASGVFNLGRLSSTAAQTKTISATINGSVAITPTGSVVVNPDAVSLSSSLVTATSPITASSGSSVSTVTVTVRDQFGNGIIGQSVTIAVSPVTGNTVTQPVGTTNTSGVITGSFSTTQATTKTVTASVTGVGTISPDNALVTVNPAAASQIAINLGNNQTARVTTAVTTDPSVVVRDAFSNPVPNVTVTFTLGVGGGSVTLNTPLTNASGIATIGSWTLGGTSADAANGTMANSLNASATGTGTVTFNASAIYILSGDVQPIYNLRCAFAGCHISGGTAPNLSAGFSHGSTVNVLSNCSPGVFRVNDGSAGLSVLYLRVSSTGTCGGPMPPGASVTVPAAEQKIIRAWINNGALNN
jgi:adhesin/invasin